MYKLELREIKSYFLVRISFFLQFCNDLLIHHFMYHIIILQFAMLFTLQCPILYRFDERLKFCILNDSIITLIKRKWKISLSCLDERSGHGLLKVWLRVLFMLSVRLYKYEKQRRICFHYLCLSGTSRSFLCYKEKREIFNAQGLLWSRSPWAVKGGLFSSRKGSNFLANISRRYLIVECERN